MGDSGGAASVTTPLRGAMSGRIQIRAALIACDQEGGPSRDPPGPLSVQHREKRRAAHVARAVCRDDGCTSADTASLRRKHFPCGWMTCKRSHELLLPLTKGCRAPGGSVLPSCNAGSCPATVNFPPRLAMHLLFSTISTPHACRTWMAIAHGHPPTPPDLPSPARAESKPYFPKWSGWLVQIPCAIIHAGTLSEPSPSAPFCAARRSLAACQPWGSDLRPGPAHGVLFEWRPSSTARRSAGRELPASRVALQPGSGQADGCSLYRATCRASSRRGSGNAEHPRHGKTRTMTDAYAQRNWTRDRRSVARTAPGADPLDPRAA